MQRISLLLLLIPASLLVLSEEQNTHAAQIPAKGTQPPGVGHQDEPDELGWCKADQEVAGVCIACAQLPGALSLPPGECCTDPDALEICRNCIRDPSICLRDVMDIVQYGGIREDRFPAYDKRYGILWFGQNPVFVPTGSGDMGSKKTFGALYSGDGAHSEDEIGSPVGKRWGSLNMNKRYGTLNLESYFAKRFGLLGLGSRYLGHMAKGYGNVAVGKRYGTLNLGGSGFRPDKRFGTLNMAKRWGTLNMGKKWGALGIGKKSDRESGTEASKRYGTLSLGKRYGSLNIGGTYGPMALGKRYGTLGMGGSYGYYPFKRSEYVPYNGNIGMDMKKRYGRLFMGRFGG